MPNYLEFCCRSGGSNLNAGTRTGNSTVPGTAADFTYASGTWVGATNTFTPVSGNPSSDGVVAGDLVSLYADGSTTTGYIAQVASVTATTIVLSGSLAAGTKPSDGAGNRTLKVGGAFAGPNAADGFPFNFGFTNAIAGSKPVRINVRNDATYSITASMSRSGNGPCRYQGFTTSYGDGGRAIIDGGTTGASYVLYSISAAYITVQDLIFQNNGATGSSNGISGGSAYQKYIRCVVNNVRGNGMAIGSSNLAVECEAYACNQNNSSNFAGFSGGTFIRCISHDNTGSNSLGFNISASSSTLGGAYNCIADSNGSHGFRTSLAAQSQVVYMGCDSYNNTGNGVYLTGSGPASVHIENSNTTKNGLYGVNCDNSGIVDAQMFNCGFGAGTEANTSGAVNGLTSSGREFNETGTVNYGSNLSPYNAPSTGDFRITLAAAKNAGRGAFLQTAPSYSGTIGYPDIGAAQHIDSGGGSSVITFFG